MISSIRLREYTDWDKLFPETFRPMPWEEALLNEILERCQSSEFPCLVNVSGLPGSGKSTLIRKLLQQPEYANFLSISFDDIMVQLPEYRDEANPRQAFQNGEARARALGYLLLERALERRLNIIFEHSSALPQHVELFRRLRRLPDHPYRIRMIHLICPLAVAEERVVRRCRETGRFVPPELLCQRQAVLTDLINRYYRSDREVVDEFTELDGTAIQGIQA